MMARIIDSIEKIDAPPIMARVFVLLMLAASCGHVNIGVKEMKASPLTGIYSCVHLVGFWQFYSNGRGFLSVLERNAEETHSSLVLLQQVEEQWRILKRISSEDTTIRAIDGHPFGAEIAFVLEMNRNVPLQIVKADLAAFIDPEKKAVPFNPISEITLSDRQIRGIRLPVSRRWNVPTPLAPAHWLFSPRIEHGISMPLHLIANTADGQAMLFSSEVDPDLEAFSIPDAAEPQAQVINGRRIAAFKRYSEPYYPFWTLSRYSGSRLPNSGDLMVWTDSEAARNLSRELSIGPVLAFEMAKGPDNRLYIFALNDAPVGTDVIVLQQQESRWSVAARWSEDDEMQQLSVECGTGRWQLIYSVPAGGGWSLKHQTWR
jgi:hypothetical protein